jgi:hypothetical protein
MIFSSNRVIHGFNRVESFLWIGSMNCWFDPHHPPSLVPPRCGEHVIRGTLIIYIILYFIQYMFFSYQL